MRFRSVDFNETSLVLVKGKYYVVATVPPDLRGKLGKQIRRSTGTSDRSLALMRKHDITEEIYNVFRKNLRVQQFPITQQFFREQGRTTSHTTGRTARRRAGSYGLPLVFRGGRG